MFSSAPLIGRLSDNVSNPRRVLQICLIGSATLWLILSQQSAFIWIALIIAIDAFIGAPIYPLSDAQALKIAWGNDVEQHCSFTLSVQNHFASFAK